MIAVAATLSTHLMKSLQTLLPVGVILFCQCRDSADLFCDFGAVDEGGDDKESPQNPPTYRAVFLQSHSD